jgi:hypothetical protein
MRARLALTTIALVLLIPAAASASLAGEQRQGQNLLAQLQAGTTTCSALSADGLDHIGSLRSGSGPPDVRTGGTCPTPTQAAPDPEPPIPALRMSAHCESTRIGGEGRTATHRPVLEASRRTSNPRIPRLPAREKSCLCDNERRARPEVATRVRRRCSTPIAIAPASQPLRAGTSSVVSSPKPSSECC